MIAVGSGSSSRFMERITQTPLMRYVPRCAANRRVFNVDMRLSISVGSRRNSGNVIQTTGLATESVRRRKPAAMVPWKVERAADDSWLTARAALMVQRRLWLFHNDGFCKELFLIPLSHCRLYNLYSECLTHEAVENNQSKNRVSTQGVKKLE